MRRNQTEPAAMETEIAHLRSLALAALRRHWRVIFGRTPPADLSKDLLGRMIAYRLQERAFGGLDRESLRFLDSLARHAGSPHRRFKPGTVLVRDYQGQRHTVTVVSDGFDAAQVSLARENPQMIVDLTNAGSPLGSDPKCVLFFLSADDAPKIDSTVVNDDVDHGACLTQIMYL
jgi:Protein of unknown function (DUF2924)